MNYILNLIDENYESDFKIFLEKYKSYTILIDNEWKKLLNFLPENYINLDEKYPLLIENLMFTGNYLQQNVKYFSLSDLIKQCVIGEEIENSRAFKILKNIPEKSIFFNSYINKNINIEILGKNEILEKNCNQKELNYYISFSEFFPLLKKKCPKIFSVILGAKILSSSFFFNEFLEVFSYNYEYPILENKFFHNFSEFKNFMKAINYVDFFSTLEEQKSFQEAFYFLQTKFNIENFEEIPYVIFQKDSIFCQNAILFSDFEKKNTQFYYLDQININYKEPIKREIKLNGENAEFFQTTYDFYMQYVLKLKKKSINSLIIKNIEDAIINKNPINKNLISNVKSILDFIDLIKSCCEIINNKIIHKNYRLFIAFSSYEINKIKTYARSQCLKKIYIANFKSFIIEEFFLRKSQQKSVVKVIY